ncbi:unnamed protein product [Ostreobium quekettii]|uniref:Elongation factor G, mitochondrial n=1 Tax=Ostreobium quekettii TaxID=121088 RepID=A0A8S1ISF5_9CHLO|nr:unnamed protein product [Ostreobium quekettii]
MRPLGPLSQLVASAAGLSLGPLACALPPAARRFASAAACGAPRWLSAVAEPLGDDERTGLASVRNIGISAHIDSGKTTLTERVLFYTGRIRAIHEVRGKDGVGAKMDSMDLEREKGITIQSAATYCQWKDIDINIIDTPGHVDFTIEVERALRVLDGAILVLCGVGGVQSQTITVDRQMRRYAVPRLAFVNKLDRAGADPWKVIEQIRNKLNENCAAVEIPLGLEDDHRGLVDVVGRSAYYFEGAKGEQVVKADVPAHLAGEMESKRTELIEKVADVDDQLADLFIGEQPIGEAELRAAIRRSTVARTFVPVFMGSAFKNRGVQLLLDGVADYLPNPLEVANKCLDVDEGEAVRELPCLPSGPLVCLAFKLEEGRYGQLTYVRVYSGTLRKGDWIVNTTNKKKVKVPRLVKMHSDELEDIAEASAGDIVAMFGVECASGDTFTDGSVRYAMTSIRVPDPVMSLAIIPKSSLVTAAFSKALQRFMKEDPTFKVALNAETGETLISGMGELHLDVYVERLRREYKVDCDIGKPKVNYREAITQRGEFDYLHKKQSGGSGQYGRVIGYIEPLPEGSPNKAEFENKIVGNAIPPEFIAACEKGFLEAVNSGGLIGHPVQGVRFVLMDGQAHTVDSSELAFKLACIYAFRQAFSKAKPVILEPIMEVEVTVPSEFQGTVIGDLNKRKGLVKSSHQERDDVVIQVDVPLNEMFGYSTTLRSQTQGKGEFTMEYLNHAPVTQSMQAELTNQFSRAKK